MKIKKHKFTKTNLFIPPMGIEVVYKQTCTKNIHMLTNLQGIVCPTKEDTFQL